MGSTVELLKKDGYDWDTYIDLKKPEYIGNLVDNDWSRGKVKVDYYATKTYREQSIQTCFLRAFCQSL